MKQLLSILAVTLLLAPMTCAAQVYKYVDEKGRTQYSDVPVGNRGQAVKNLNANTIDGCDAQCQKRMAEDKHNKRYDEIARTMPESECQFLAYSVNAQSKALAQQAANECKHNYVMKRLDPSYRPTTAAAEQSRAANTEMRSRLQQQQQQMQQQQAQQQQAAQHRETMNRLDSIERKSNQPDNIRLQGPRGNSTDCRRTYGSTYDCR